MQISEKGPAAAAVRAHRAQAAGPGHICSCPRPALPLLCPPPCPVQGSGTAEQLRACPPGRSVPRSAQASQQHSVLPCPFPPGPHGVTGARGAVPDTSRPAQGAEGGHGPDPRPAPVRPASPARHGGEPRAVSEGLRGGTGGSAPAASTDPAPAAAPAPWVWAGTAALGDSGQPPRTCAYFSYKGKGIRTSEAAERKDGGGGGTGPALAPALPPEPLRPTWQQAHSSRCECGVKGQRWPSAACAQSHAPHRRDFVPKTRAAALPACSAGCSSLHTAPRRGEVAFRRFALGVQKTGLEGFWKAVVATIAVKG